MKVNFYINNKIWINKINKEILDFIEYEEEFELKYHKDDFKLKLIDFLLNRYKFNIIDDENFDYFSTKFNSDISDLFIELRDISELLCNNFFSNKNSYNLLCFLFENISLINNDNDNDNENDDIDNYLDEIYFDYDIFDKFEM